MLKPGRETVGSVLKFSTPSGKITIMRVIDVGKTGTCSLLQLVRARCGEEGISTALLDGGMTAAARAENLPGREYFTFRLTAFKSITCIKVG